LRLPCGVHGRGQERPLQRNGHETNSQIRGCERSLQIIDKESHLAAWRSVDDPLERWQDRQCRLLWFPVPPLMLREGQFAVPDVLASKARDVGATLPGEKQECECQSSFSSDWVTRLELVDLLNRPSGVTGGIVALEVRNVSGWII
jgi:hypothetical protein